MKKLKLTMLCLMASIVCAKAQIGYQISLLNTATGEPRANETVTVSVSLSNSVGQVFYSETKSATTNDFGVLSLTIGNADTFKNVDITKMPFYIEVTANGVIIGKSQILSVPVAEVAKQLAPMDRTLYLGTWRNEGYKDDTLTFTEDGTVIRKTYWSSEDGESGCDEEVYEYFVDGNAIYIVISRSNSRGGSPSMHVMLWRIINGKLVPHEDDDISVYIRS